MLASIAQQRPLFRKHCRPPPCPPSSSAAAAELDERCEAFLARQFGLRIDFTTEAAVPALASWGLVAEAEGGALQVWRA